MNEIDKDIELGILQGKSIKWAEPYYLIPDGSIIIEIPLNKYIKWYKGMKRLHRNNKWYQRKTINFIDESYVVNWAWIE
jgi:hypothetical protein